MGDDKKIDSYIDPKLGVLLFAINDLLDFYVDIHDRIFKFSWRQIVPIPGFFKKIDFKKAADDLTRIYSEIQKYRSVMDVLNPSLNDYNRKTYFLLIKFSDALGDTVSRLSEISIQLWYKVNKPSSYSYEVYDAAYKRYETSIMEYKKIGEELNRSCQAS